MADAKKNEDDPSIEEILDSIRRIISDDDVPEEEPVVAKEPLVAKPPPPPPPPPVKEAPNPPPPLVKEAPKPPPPPPVVPESEEEVFVLTERAEPEPEDPIVEEMQAVVEEAISKQPMQVDLRDALEEKIKPYEEEEPEDMDSVLSRHAEEEAYHAISDLARKVAMGKSHLTLEDIVRQELKPLLRGWLNQHLSDVIDRLVREELERVSNRVLQD